MAAISEETCPICLEFMETPFITFCNHKFHSICLDKHFENSIYSKCPLCNKVLYSEHILPNTSEPNTSEPNTSEPNTSEPNTPSESDEPLSELLTLLNKTTALANLILEKLDMIMHTVDPQIAHLLTVSTQNENEALIWYFTKIRSELALMETSDMLEQYLAIDYVIRTWPNPNLDENKLNAVKDVLSSLGRSSLLTNELFIYTRLFR